VKTRKGITAASSSRNLSAAVGVVSGVFLFTIIVFPSELAEVI
jgi:hypothetical protein